MRVVRLLPVHLALAAYCAGLCLSLAWRPPLAMILSLAAACVLPLAARGRSRVADRLVGAGLALCVAVLLLGAGTAVGSSRLRSVDESLLKERVGERVSLAATVVDLPTVKARRATVRLQVTALEGVALHEATRLSVRLPDDETCRRLCHPCTGLVEGMIVHIAGARVEPLPVPKDGFDYARYLERRGEHVLLAAELEDITVVGRRGGFAGFADRLRLSARASLRRGVPSPAREVLQGMVLGDDEGIDEALADVFRRSGLMHIMAVSGENVVLVCALLGAVLQAVGLRRRLRLAVLLPAVAIYVVVAGASPSIVRAGIAGAIMLLAGLLSRPTDAPLLLLVPASIMLTINPNSLFDVSFQLSFAAVLGLFLLGGRLTRLFGRLPGPLAEQAGVTTAASLATAPVSLATFGQVSLVAVPANLFGGFVLGQVMLFGMLSVAVGFVWPAASAVLNVMAGTLIGFLITVASLFAGLPGATYSWHGATIGFCLSLALIGVVMAVVVLAAREGVGLVRYLASGRRWLAVGLACSVLVALVLVLAPSAPAGPGRPSIVFLDVGEGSATLVQAPGRDAVLIDGGPGPLRDQLWRHGVDRVGLLIVSHGHADHIGGIRDVIGDVPIDLAVLPRPPTAGPAIEELAQRLSGAGTQVVRWSKPLAVPYGPFTLTVVSCHSTGSSDQNQNENDNGLVVSVRTAAGDVLVPGDAEAAALKPLVLAAHSVVAAPHHGSGGGFDEDLLAALAPRLVVISVGENSYGHPTPSTLSLLREHGVPFLRTDQQGDVTLNFQGARFLVSTQTPAAAARPP